MKKTRVVHCKRERYDVMIDRTTMFGNPFPLSKYSREESIEKYREWFLLRTNVDAFFNEAVQNLKGKILGCWCKPLACHGDVIVEYLENQK